MSYPVSWKWKNKSGGEKMTVKIIGKMDNTKDHTFEIANRVYDINELSPTITNVGGGW